MTSSVLLSRTRELTAVVTVDLLNAAYGQIILPGLSDKRICVVGASMTPTLTPDTATGFYLEEAVTNVYTITLASNNVADTVVISGLTFTAAAAADLPNRKWAQAGSDTANAISLAAAINHASAGVPGVLATPAAAVVTLTSKTNVDFRAATGVGSTRLVTVPAGSPVIVGEFLVGAALINATELVAAKAATGFTAGAGWQAPLGGGRGLKVITHGTAAATMTSAKFRVSWIWV